MKIYTKTGDDGSTGLIGGVRVGKADPRIECYGTVDELNATLGIARAALTDRELDHRLKRVQDELFVLGSHLALPDAPGSKPQAWLPALEDTFVIQLESEIDSAESELLPLRQFILPGGTEAGARLHFSRTVCRRAERLVVAFSGQNSVSPVMLTYLNRLSDWLFVHARLVNRRADVEDIPWTKR